MHFRTATVGQRSLHSWGRLRRTIKSAAHLRRDSTERARGVDGLETTTFAWRARSRRQQITLYGGAGARCLNCARVLCVSTICSATAVGAPLSMFALAIGTLANTAKTYTPYSMAKINDAPTALFTGAKEEAHRGPQSMQEHQTRVPRAQLRRARPSPRKMLQGVRSRPHQQ